MELVSENLAKFELWPYCGEPPLYIHIDIIDYIHITRWYNIHIAHWYNIYWRIFLTG